MSSCDQSIARTLKAESSIQLSYHISFLFILVHKLAGAAGKKFDS